MPHFSARPGGQHQGQHTHDESQRGHQDRPQAQAGRFNRRLDRRAPGKLQLPRKLDDQNRVFGRQTNQHDQPDLGEDVVVSACEFDPQHGGQQAHRHDQNDGDRQRQAFILRSQHQKHQQQRQGEHPHGRVARDDFLVRQVRPLVGNAGRQRFSSNAGNRVLRLAGRITRRSAAVDIGRQKAVVANRPLRPKARRDLHQRGQRHHLARAGTHLEQADVFGPRAVGRVGLHPHRIGPAKLVEVVGVQAAQVDLHGVKHVGDRHAQLARLGAVDVGIQLRHVDLEARKQPRQLRRFCGLGHEGFGGLVHLGIAQRRTVFQLQLEAAGGAQALHGRWREHGDEGLFNCAELAVELARNRAGAQVCALALVKRLEGHKHNARVGAVGKTVDRQARKRNRVGHAGLLHGDVADAADHVFGAVQRGPVRQLGKTDQVLLVLAGHKAARHGLEQAHRGQHQHAIDHQHDRFAGNRPLHAPAVPVRAAAEETVEGAEKAAKQLVHAAGQRVFGRVVALKQQRRQRGRQRQRVDGRNHGGNRNRQRKLFVELARQPADEGQRHKHGDQHQRNRDDGPGHLAHGLVGSLARGQPGLDVALHVFDHHDGVVHHNADG